MNTRLIRVGVGVVLAASLAACDGKAAGTSGRESGPSITVRDTPVESLTPYPAVITGFVASVQGDVMTVYTPDGDTVVTSTHPDCREGYPFPGCKKGQKPAG